MLKILVWSWIVSISKMQKCGRFETCLPQADTSLSTGVWEHLFKRQTPIEDTMAYKHIQAKTACVMVTLSWQRTSGMMTPTTSSLPPSPDQMAKGTKCSSFLYFSATLPFSTLLCSPLMLSRVFVSSSLISFISYFAQGTQMGKYDAFAKEQHLLFFISKATYLSSSSSHLRHWNFLPSLSFFTKIFRLRILPQFCNSIFFSHLKRIEEKCGIPTQFIRNKTEAENQVTEPDRQQSRLRKKSS